MTRLGTIGAACLAVALAASSPALARGGHVGGGGGFHAAAAALTLRAAVCARQAALTSRAPV